MIRKCINMTKATRKNVVYTIYHIPGIKIGCTEQRPEKRVASQYYKEFEILEQYEDIYIASNREIELQKQYGYEIDKMPYWKMRERFTVEMVVEAAKKAGEKTGKKNVESGHWASIKTTEHQRNASKASAKVRALLTKEQAEQIKKEYIRGSKDHGQIALAKKYGVSQMPIRMIINGTFTNYKEPENE